MVLERSLAPGFKDSGELCGPQMVEEAVVLKEGVCSLAISTEPQVGASGRAQAVGV
jgi:hypothetical protein